MAIRFFFEYENQIIQLPVNPAAITIQSSGNNRTEEVVSLGEISILKTPKLKECSIECFFPATSTAPYVLTAGGFQLPQFYINYINTIRTAKKPCRFIVSDTSINMLVSIENFEYGYKAGDDDTHYKLTLKEYRTYSAKVVTIQTNTNTATQSSSTRPPSTSGSFSIGDSVSASGTYTADSYGGGRSGTFASNFIGKITLIVADTTRPRRYHISTSDGSPLGWVTATQISHQ